MVLCKSAIVVCKGDKDLNLSKECFFCSLWQNFRWNATSEIPLIKSIFSSYFSYCQVRGDSKKSSLLSGMKTKGKNKSVLKGSALFRIECEGYSLIF